MCRRLFACLLIAGLAPPTARGQIPVARSSIPTRSAMERLGLEKNWDGYVPLTTSERVVMLSLAEGLLIAQTSMAQLHVYEAETGRLLWSKSLGRSSLNAQPASVNSDRVFATNYRTLYCIDRATGRTVWQASLESYPSSPTAADEEHVVVGLANGKLVGYSVRDHTQDDPPGYSAGTNVFNWQTVKTITGRPLPAERVIAFGSEDGRAYTAQIDPKLLLWRFLTGGPIKASMTGLGTRTLLIPSTDNSLYAVDLYDASTRWTYASGAPINQEPMVADQEVFVLNSAGDLASLDPDRGTPKWTINIRRAQILAVSPSRVYGRSLDGDLAFVDRATGKMLALPRDTAERAGLNLREFTLAVTNHLNDRLYFATPTGMLYSIRELGQVQPVLLRHPSRLPFGKLPDGEAPTPPPSPAAGDGEAPEFGVEEMPDGNP